MAVLTLLDVVKRRYAVAVDADSDGGQFLNSLVPHGDFGDGDLSGKADVAALTFSLTSGGVSIRAAQASDALVFTLPAGPVDFKIIPPAPDRPAPVVEILLADPKLPLPFLRPAAPGGDGFLTDPPGKVMLDLPDLLLVVTASVTPPAHAKLAPSHDAAGALTVTMLPPLALLGPGTVLGFGFERGTLNLDGPGEPEITVPKFDIYIAPEGIPPLAMRGGARDLTIGLGVGNGGLTGTFSLALADGAQAPKRPRFLRNMAAQLRLQRNRVIMLELTGKAEIGGEARLQLNAPLPDGSGLVDYRLGLALDQGWQASLSLSAAGQNYLWRTKRSNAADPARDTLGAYAVFSPLLVGSIPGAGESGYVDLALGAGAAGLLAASQWIKTQSVTLFGASLVIHRPAAGSPQGFLFAEVETEFHLDVHVGGAKIISTRKPLKVRQKALGLRLDFGSGDAPTLKPVFDPAQGFSLDLSDPGTFEIPGVLGDILQPDRVRMARENPLYFEVDLITKADLGVVTIDRASVRVPLTGGGGASLRGLGAHLDAGPIQGGGYLKISEHGIEGGLDASFAPPLGIRASANLKLGEAHDSETNEKMTSVLAGFNVEWPVPIPIANSGLGLFGFLGLFGMHIKRDDGDRGALQWYVDANGDPAAGDWRGAAHSWAIGLGAVIGTVEGGFLIHAKGMLMIELPGPRILLAMKADIMKTRPSKEGADTGRLLAIIDIRPESLTIGVVAEYSIPFLLEVRVPAEAFFDFQVAENWHLDVGQIPPKLAASVRFMSILRADGYLMIHGNGIDDFPLRKLEGFAVAAGIRAALTWGPQDIGLYIRVAAEADVAVSFKPSFIIGKMTLEGELHLFIVSIGASAIAEVEISPETDKFLVKARVCGEVDFFFFSVEGCVTLKLGEEVLAPPSPPALVRALSLHSRSPALLPGSGADRPVDGSLGNAFHRDAQGQFVGDRPDAVMPTVPIDAIPVLEFEMRMQTASDCRFFDASVPSLLNQDQWVRRGERFYRYSLKSIELTRIAGEGAPLFMLDGDETPVAWWDRHGKPTPGEDSDVQLALLNWIPDPTPAAAERTLSRDNRIKKRWGNVCAEVAPRAPVLWTFLNVAAGPSRRGWALRGTPWPDDPADSVRSSPPDTLLRISEPWRSGDIMADALIEIDPVFVCASSAVRERVLVAPRVESEPGPRIVDDDRFASLARAFSVPRPKMLADALRFATKGTRRIRALVYAPRGIGQFVLRQIGETGEPTGFEKPIDSSNSWPVQGMQDLPGEWKSQDSPWFATVQGVLEAWANIYLRLAGDVPTPLLTFLELDLPEGAREIELGFDRDGGSAEPARWIVLIVEAISEAEYTRFTFDKQQRDDRIALVNGALGADDCKRALLMPGSLYALELIYDVAATKADEKGDPAVAAIISLPEQSQQFRFATEAQPPERLESWVMASAPDEGEAGHFTADPIRIVFSTNATRKLFKAYGFDLLAHVKAASGKHPPDLPGFDPAKVRLDATNVVPKILSEVVATPFASAFGEAMAGQSCVSHAHRTNRHELVTLTLKLEPSTEYILDLEAERPNGSSTNPQPAYPMFRRNFTTSRYAGIDAFAADVKGVPVVHRHIANPAVLAALAAHGAEVAVREGDLDAALRQARWGDIGKPTTPRVTVIWRAGAPAEPFAVLVETLESAWRMRAMPELDQSPDGVKRYRLVDRWWLELVESSAAPAKVSRLLHTSGGTRTLALLAAGNRGSTVQLSLKRTPHPLFEGNGAPAMAMLARVVLRAPWEEMP